MVAYFGPLTEARFNQLPDGPSLALYYQDLCEALSRYLSGDPTWKGLLICGSMSSEARP
jgi:hypothetical protein